MLHTPRIDIATIALYWRRQGSNNLSKPLFLFVFEKLLSFNIRKNVRKRFCYPLFFACSGKKSSYRKSVFFLVRFQIRKEPATENPVFALGSSLLRNRKSPAQNCVFPSLRLCFEAENNRLKIKPVSVFSLGSLLLRSETDSLTEPAKQRYRRFSFCLDIPLSSKIKPTDNLIRTRILVSLFFTCF